MAQLTAYVGATLIDGQGSPPVPRAVLLTEKDTIRAVGLEQEVEIPPDAAIERLDGLWLMPGMIDAHIHLGRRSLDLSQRIFIPEALWAARATADLRKLMEAGFTTVRDCGGSIAISMARAVQEGSIVGPRILAAGRFIERTGGADAPCFMPLCWAHAPHLNAPRLADGPDECRRAVREQLRDGAHFVKTCTTGGAYNTAGSRIDILEWTDEEVIALADEAHRLGVKLAVHAHAASGVRQAIEAGADTIEHGTLIDEECCRMMADRGIFLIPTFFTLHRMATAGSTFGAPDFAVEKAKGLHEAHGETFRLALRHKVPIAMGTDCGGASMNPHGANAGELVLMVEAGMPASDALVATTSGAARALGIDHEVGALMPGLRADLVALRADPLADMRALQEVALVVQGGAVMFDRRSRRESA